MWRPLCGLALPPLPRAQGPACARPITGCDHPSRARQRRPPFCSTGGPRVSPGAAGPRRVMALAGGGGSGGVCTHREQGAPGMGGLPVVGRAELGATTVGGAGRNRCGGGGRTSRAIQCVHARVSLVCKEGRQRATRRPTAPAASAPVLGGCAGPP